MSYNAKINKDGTYRPFYGWTVISKVYNDLTFLENYIKYNNVINSYFSFLPSSSYHITIYNVWSNFSTLLKEQQQYIDNENIYEIRDELISMSISNIFFNPSNCLKNIFKNIKNKCNTYNTLTLTINGVYITENTIGITFKNSDNIKHMDNTRNIIAKICERDDGFKHYHMTLGYRYKDKGGESLRKEIKILNMLLCNQTVTISTPRLCYFTDMTKFTEI